MSKESIFHKLVKSENSYTQLLCNMLKRDGDFRGQFFDLFDLKEKVNPSDIHTQVGLPTCGQADILIRSSRLRMIVEVKTDSHRDLRDTQRLLDDPASYQGWLKSQEAAEAWLVFLVPTSWKYRPKNEEEIKGYRQKGLENGIKVQQIFWEDILTLLDNKKQSEVSLPREYLLLLEERFGPIGFDKEETMSMFDESLPLGTVLKLNALIDKIRSEFKLTASPLEIYKDGFGFYLEQKKTCWLYFGCWGDFWKNNHRDNSHHPICFGVEDVSYDVRVAFERSLKRVYSQSAIAFEESWLMGWIPEKDLINSNAAQEISPKLRKIWKSMCDAAARESISK